MHQQLFELSTTKYYGFYRGQVMNNVDPDKAGKCQIAIGPMFLNIPIVNLPWCFPAQPVTFGSGVGYGTMNIPNISSWVYCFFLEGDVYQPIYCFEAPTLTQGVPSNTSPTIRGFTSPSGIQISIDDGNNIITITNKTGVALTIDGTGTVNLISSNKIFVSAPELDTTGNVNVGSGATGTFGTTEGSLITVVNGIVTDID
jgi:hypothetical protein